MSIPKNQLHFIFPQVAFGGREFAGRAQPRLGAPVGANEAHVSTCPTLPVAPGWLNHFLFQRTFPSIGAG